MRITRDQKGKLQNAIQWRNYSGKKLIKHNQFYFSLLAWWFIQDQWVTTMKLLTPWEPGSQLLTDFDIKLGRLASSIKNKSCTDIEIKKCLSDCRLVNI